MNKAAEILVECGYADAVNDDHVMHAFQCDEEGNVDFYAECVDPFADTLEGRKQADAIEDWLIRHNIGNWMRSGRNKKNGRSSHQWRLDRIRCCLEQLDPQITCRGCGDTITGAEIKGLCLECAKDTYVDHEGTSNGSH